MTVVIGAVIPGSLFRALKVLLLGFLLNFGVQSAKFSTRWVFLNLDLAQQSRLVGKQNVWVFALKYIKLSSCCGLVPLDGNQREAEEKQLIHQAATPPLCSWACLFQRQLGVTLLSSQQRRGRLTCLMRGSKHMNSACHGV